MLVCTMNRNSPEYYAKLILTNPSREDLTRFSEEITEILVAMKKGLDLLQKVGRNPEPMVLENQKDYNAILAKITKML